MLTIEKAREWLRIDGTDNDDIITGLLGAIPSYIEVSTGMAPEQQEKEPLAEAAAKFVLALWYNAELAENEKLQCTIDNLLKALTMKVH